MVGRGGDFRRCVGLLLAALVFTTASQAVRGDDAAQNMVVAPNRIPTGGALRSRNGKYLLAMQYDCNLVLYEVPKNNLPLWASGTSDHGANCYAVMRSDGNFVLYDGAHISKFETHTDIFSCTGTFLAVLQDDGNFVVYCEPKGGTLKKSTALWATGTDGW